MANLISDAIMSAVNGVISGASGIIKDFKADPNKVLDIEENLKQLQLQAQQEADKTALAIADIHQKDIDSARNMNIQIETSEKSSWLSKNIPYMIAIFVLLIWGSITIYIMARMMNIISADAKVDFTSLLAMYSGISVIAGTVINFYFGSSSGSADKSKQIEAMVKSANS